jgi:hypothetical protein
MILLEPDVALTDFGLAAECALFAGWLCQDASGAGPLRRWFFVLFAALGAGALLGGVTHGFIGDPQPPTVSSHGIWVATLVAIAGAGLACWAVGAHTLLPQRMAGWVVAAALLLFAVNVAVVVWRSQAFATAVAFYAPAVTFVLIAFVLAYRRTGKTVLLPGIAGVVLTLAAALIQQIGLGVPALGLTHNALYHLVQAVGLALIFLTARRFTPPHVSREINKPTY